MQKFDQKRSFMFRGQVYDYIDHPSNQTALNERRVELPIAKDFVKGIKSLLEIGNVTFHYGFALLHDVVDLNEKIPNVKYNADILRWRPTREYAQALSISTLEHTDNPFL